MDRLRRSEIIFALVAALFGALTLAVWIPNDIETGLIDTFRRQTFIGDALIPVIAAAIILVCAILHLLVTVRGPGEPLLADAELGRESLGFMLIVGAIIALALVVMFWLGPLVAALTGEAAGYRTLRDTAPYKYLGFLAGGMIMVLGLVTLVEGRLQGKRVLAVLGAVIVLIIIFDVPFDSLLLPPNGDW